MSHVYYHREVDLLMFLESLIFLHDVIIILTLRCRVRRLKSASSREKKMCSFHSTVEEIDKNGKYQK